jgi:hypothetical protein
MCVFEYIKVEFRIYAQYIKVVLQVYQKFIIPTKIIIVIIIILAS